MSDSDRHFEITGTQVVASLLAAISGAVLASYLGVAGTIIGTAMMSVAGTAGAAVYKSYLGRTARRLKERAPEIAQRAAERMTPVSTRGNTQRRQTRADSTRADSTRADSTRADSTRADQNGSDSVDDQATQVFGFNGDGRPTQAGGGWPTGAGGAKPDRPERLGWLRKQPTWLRAGLATLVIFLVVIGGLSVVELAAGKPLQSLVWNHKGTGTTVGGLVGGQSSQTKPTTPATHTTKPTPATTSPSTTPTSPSVSPSVTPTSASPTPTTTSPSVSTSPSSAATATPAS
ncbi:MAG TPA: hypothetical protein VGH27_29230 [Streptosporangiaceae bacterium]|jgi:hypothetical protein